MCDICKIKQAKTTVKTILNKSKVIDFFQPLLITR
jgi:hypothetical protein